MADLIRTIERWLVGTALNDFVLSTFWVWPTLETLHFLGLGLLIGTVGLFDLRLLGLAKSIPPATLHRLIPWGVLGYSVNVITGTMFLTATPDQYFYNAAFQFKMAFMFLTGVNVLVFYLTVYREVDAMGSGDPAPKLARIIGGASLVLWIGVMTCGRLLTFFRP